MRYIIGLDAELGITGNDFVDAWNNSKHVELGKAEVDTATHASFMPLELTVALIAAAATIPTTVISSFISDYLRKKLIDGDHKKVTVTTISAPDGQPILIIKQEES